MGNAGMGQLNQEEWNGNSQQSTHHVYAKQYDVKKELDGETSHM